MKQQEGTRAVTVCGLRAGRTVKEIMRSLALELDVSRTTVRKIVLEDLRYKSYAMRSGHFMSAATKARRLDKAKIKHPIVPNPLIFFSDEKNFTQDQKVNRK